MDGLLKHFDTSEINIDTQQGVSNFWSNRKAYHVCECVSVWVRLYVCARASVGVDVCVFPNL